jgi:hypothetical protein
MPHVTVGSENTDGAKSADRTLSWLVGQDL